MTVQVKQSVSTKIPVSLVNVVDFTTPTTGKSGTDATVTFLKSDGTISTLSGTATMTEITSGAFSGQGIYQLTIPSSVTDVVGTLDFAILVSGSEVFKGFIDVVANIASDIFTRVGAPAGASISADIAAVKTVVDSISSTTGGSSTTINTINSKIGTPVTTVSGDIASVQSDTDDIQTKIGTPSVSLAADIAAIQLTVSNIEAIDILLQKYEENRWKVHKTGPDANRLVYYDNDGVTPLLKFDLFDDVGAPTSDTPFERVPV